MKYPWLMQGDCLELMNNIPAHSVDLVLCDLPYGITNCAWDKIIPFNLLWKHYRRVLSTRGAVALTANQPFTSLLVLSNREWFKYCLVWEKSRVTGILGCNSRPLRIHEDIAIFSPAACSNKSKVSMIYNPQKGMGKPYSSNNRKGDLPLSMARSKVVRIPTINNGDRFPKSVIRFRNDEFSHHPTQKPVALMEYFIRTYTNENAIVLDNCMGSGTTGVAALLCGRKFIGIEKEKEYFEIAKERIGTTQQTGLVMINRPPKKTGFFQ